LNGGLLGGTWEKIPEATGSEYTTVAQTTPNTDYYRCEATGLGGTATSNNAEIITDE